MNRQTVVDAAGRAVQSGRVGMNSSYAGALNLNVSQADTLGLDIRQTVFDTEGRVQKMRTLNADGAGKSLTDYTGGYDTAGNVVTYSAYDYASGVTNTYQRTLQRFDAYKEARVDAWSTQNQPGATLESFDAMGNLRGIDDTTNNNNDRSFVNDLAGRALYDIQAGNVQRQLIVNGDMLGRYGLGIDELTPKDSAGNPNFAALASFNFGYQKITGSYPAGTASGVGLAALIGL